MKKKSLLNTTEKNKQTRSQIRGNAILRNINKLKKDYRQEEESVMKSTLSLIQNSTNRGENLQF